MRDAITRGDWDRTAACLATEWDNRKRLAPGVTTPAIDQLIARATAAGAKAAKVCGAGGGGCMFCLADPDDVSRVREALADGGATTARLPHRNHRTRCYGRMTAPLPSPLDNRAVARTLSEIADLLELKGDNPFKIRAYRNAADIVSHAAEQVAGLDEAALRAWNGIGKDLAGRIREIAQTGDCAIRRELLTEFPATLLDVLRLQGVGPKTVAISVSRAAHQEPRRPHGGSQGGTNSIGQGHGRRRRNS